MMCEKLLGRTGSVAGAALLGLAACFVASGGTAFRTELHPEPLATRMASAKFALAGFEENCGQFPRRAAFDYVARGRAQNLVLKGGEAVLTLRPIAKTVASSGAVAVKHPAPTLRMRVAHSSRHPQTVPGDPLPCKVSYFHGVDPRLWRTGIRSFGEVRYEDVRPGIDLVYYAKNQTLEYDLVVHPGADLREACLEFCGAERATLNKDGSLELVVGDRQVTHQQPVAYQELEGRRLPVSAAFKLGEVWEDGNRQATVVAGFDIGEYDPSRPLIIDPVVTFSSFLGGSGYDEGTGIGVDAQRFTYVSGITDSMDFPGAGLPPPGAGSSDVFVAKFTPDGQSLVYAAYLGGNDTDVARGLSVLPDGRVIIAGSTFSTNFPVVNAAQSLPGGGIDGFASCINAAGSALLYSTYLGGAADDLATAVSGDAAGSASVVGTTFSANFPTYQALQPVRAGSLPRSDAFITRLSATGAIVFSTYLGGAGHDSAYSVTTNSGGRTWLTGYTESTDFPLANPMQAVRSGDEGDAFVASLTSTGNSLYFSTYLGGSGGDAGQAIAIDASGRSYVAGVTESADFPSPEAEGGNPHTHSPGAIGILHTGFHGGEGDAFVVRMHSNGKSLEYAHLVGGVGFDTAMGVGVDSLGRAQVVGFSDSVDVSQLYPLQPGYGGGSRDAFLLGVNSRGTAHTYISYFGGGGSDRGRAIVVLPDGEARITGETSSNDFLKINSWQDHLAGGTQFGGDAFVTTFTGPTLPPPPTGVTALVRSRNAIRLRWEDQSDDETAFVVERREGDSEPLIVATVGSSITTAEDRSIIANHPYTYRVFAINSVGRSDSSPPVQALLTPTARLEITKRLNFGAVRVGTSSRKVLRLRNRGSGAVTVWLDAPQSPFAIVGPAVLVIAPRTAVDLSVEVRPTNPNTEIREVLRMRSSDPGKATASVLLQCKALPGNPSAQ